MRIGILGTGMLGKELKVFETTKKVLDTFYHEQKHQYDLTEYPHYKYDILNNDNLLEIVLNNDIVVNCAAFTNVDKAEFEHNELNWKVNAEAVKMLAQLCKIHNKKLVHISTDFVYGDNDVPWELIPHKETSKTNPCNEYGKAKLKADTYISSILDESEFLILRVSWTFGIFGENFISKVYQKLIDSKVKELSIPCDQIGRPTSTELICEILFKFFDGELPGGIYNLQNPGNRISKYELAKFIRNYINNKTKIKKSYTLKNTGFATRQFNSLMDLEKISKEIDFDTLWFGENWKNMVEWYIDILEKRYAPKKTLWDKIKGIFL